MHYGSPYRWPPYPPTYDQVMKPERSSREYMIRDDHIEKMLREQLELIKQLKKQVEKIDERLREIEKMIAK